MGEQRSGKAAAARCMQLLRTHGKHYVASGTLINEEIVQICCFDSHICTVCVTVLDLWFSFRLKTLQMGTGLMDSLTHSLCLCVPLVQKTSPIWPPLQTV